MYVRDRRDSFFRRTSRTDLRRQEEKQVNTERAAETDIEDYEA